jgi:flagellar biosynthesis chaperone FliJ
MSEEKQMWDINEFAGVNIRMRKSDGYFNAKDICKVNNKRVTVYMDIKNTQKFIKALKADLKENTKDKVGQDPDLPVIEEITTGPNNNRGTWVHPDIAINLAQWVSPEFSVQVSKWVRRYLQGDITLVRDIVDRHDALNNTRSEVLITTLSNQVEEYKTQLNTLENAVETLRTQITNLNKLHCDYCNKRYSSTAGITRHLKNCPDKKISEYRMLVPLDKFQAYIELVSESYELEGIEFKFVDWDSDKPTVKVKKDAKRYNYRIYLNSSRWKLLKLLQEYICIPIETLLSENCFIMYKENADIFKIIKYNLHDNNGDTSLEVELKIKLGIIQDD